MKLALYLPNFRDKVTVQELRDLTALAEDLDFDSIWTLDRIVVPEAPTVRSSSTRSAWPGDTSNRTEQASSTLVRSSVV